MKVSVSKLEVELDKLNDLAEQYQNINGNLYNEFVNASDFWKSEKSVLFFEKVKHDDLDVKKTIDEIKKISDVYKYIVQKYKEIGSTVEFNLSVYDSLLTSFDELIDNISSIIDKYSNLDYSFSYNEFSHIYNQKVKLEKTLNTLLEYKEKIKTLLFNLKEIEDNVNLKLSNIDISIINETDNSRFV